MTPRALALAHIWYRHRKGRREGAESTMGGER